MFVCVFLGEEGHPMKVPVNTLKSLYLEVALPPTPHLGPAFRNYVKTIPLPPSKKIFALYV